MTFNSEDDKPDCIFEMLRNVENPSNGPATIWQRYFDNVAFVIHRRFEVYSESCHYGSHTNSGELTSAQTTSSARSRHWGVNRVVGGSPFSTSLAKRILIWLDSDWRWFDQATPSRL